MLKKTLLFMLSFFVATGLALAEVDVNKADQAALDGVRGIGPSMSRRILDERQKGGSFKDWSDLQARVKGIKDKAAAKLSANGLTVNGQAKAGASGEAAAAKSGKTAKSPHAENKGKGAADKMADEPTAPRK
ncbi:helix-hairpin-helix domain-containing protein [Herbaspirillum sp. AP02]|uniref:ComEA family DNA-binding protein n=1 Tax=unclassified Herbaspirillum TaxID=2624150 RepID=UPI0015D9854B|nr:MULTISPECIES: helix-hairpin-helix domain-containing protein [unclassified Herbaspirillum]MBG7621436.1 helix-hairpin-helix domain-containing protein [Herbaspirillum sp. AP02]NZD66985.1 helix-hairpin-helix domain-containing protein [Herbaspirillum sp. AP21]